MAGRMAGLPGPVALSSPSSCEGTSTANKHGGGDTLPADVACLLKMAGLWFRGWCMSQVRLTAVRLVVTLSPDPLSSAPRWCAHFLTDSCPQCGKHVCILPPASFHMGCPSCLAPLLRCTLAVFTWRTTGMAHAGFRDPQEHADCEPLEELAARLFLLSTCASKGL